MSPNSTSSNLKAADVLTLAAIMRARRTIAKYVEFTPLLFSSGLSRVLGADVQIKIETVQPTGSFKVRGATNVVLSLEQDARQRGLVTYSTGNHGRATAWIGQRAGTPVTVCVSELASRVKVDALRSMGCQIRISGRSQDDAASLANALAASDGLTLVDPINDYLTITGHGTIGLEVLERCPDIDTIVVPVSGGALIAGIATAAKAINPNCKIVGVSMERGAAMHASLNAGQPVLVEEVLSVADSLQGGILLDNKFTFDAVRNLVDELVLVSEEEIEKAMTWAFLCERLVLEGAAATPIAALLFRQLPMLNGRIAVVVTGSAVRPSELAKISFRHRHWLQEFVAAYGIQA